MTASPARERAWDVALGLVLLAVVGAVYGRALRAPFVFDDRVAIVENPSIRRLWPPLGTRDEPGPLAPPPLAPTARRPLANLSFAFDYRLYGLAPAGWRATNLALHALTAALVAALVRRTLRLPYFAGAWMASAWWIAAAVAVVWAVHPLVTEAVVYVTQRTELLAACCYVATLLAAVRHWTAATPRAARVWLLVAVAANLAGVASKELVASAPLAVLLYDLTFRDPPAARPGTSPRPNPLVLAGRVVRRSPRMYLGLALGWVALVLLSLGGVSGLSDARHTVAPPVWWATQVKVHVLYLKRAVWPWPLAVHYAPAYLSAFTAAWPWLLAGALAAGGVGWAVRRRPAARVVVLTIALVLAPTFLVPLPMMAAERRMYLPLAGLVALAAVAGARAVGTRRLVAGAAALAAVLAVVTVHRLSAWESAVALWEDTVRTQPADALARYNLGVALLEAGRPPAEAIARFEETLRLDPAHTGALDTLGLALQRLGRSDEARARFEQALALDPEDAVAHNALGALLLARGEAAAALPHLERALRHEPDLPKSTVHRNLGRALLDLGRVDAALAHLDQAVRLAPDDPEPLADRGVALIALGRPADAIPSLEAALRARPDDRATENTLATALLQAGRIAEAVILLERVLAHRPDDVAARNNLGTALRTLGRTPEAMAQFAAVLAGDPENATAHYNLGSALLDGSRPGEAAPHFEAVLRRAPDDAQAHFKVAIAYAQSGRRADGVAAAERALAGARAQGQAALADDVERWLAGYRATVPPGGGRTRSGSGKAGPPPRSM